MVFQKFWKKYILILLTIKITQIIRFWCLNFDTKIYFYYVLIPDWERKEMLLDSGGRERKISLTPIYTTKTIEVCLKQFHLMRRDL